MFIFGFLLSLLTSIVGVQSTDIYTYEAPILNIVIGECITLNALVYFPHNKSAIITWKKDMKVIEHNTERMKISADRKSMYISSLRREDHAYYQVVLKDPQTRITEVTDIWLNIIECRKNQKEETPSSPTACSSLCVDKCTDDWQYISGTSSKCCQYFDKPKSWSDASESCQSIGGELATINTRQENEFLGDMLQTAAGGWIGLNDRNDENTYIWNFKSSKRPSFYTWGAGEPSNYNRACNIENCVAMKMSNSDWLDIVCESFNSYVCEVSSAYNGTDQSEWRCAGSKCFKYYHNQLVWKDALTRCKQIHSSANLASIASDGENNLVRSLLLSENAWIGLNDLWEAGLYCWNDCKGSTNEASYTNWGSGEPNDKFTQPLAPECLGEDCIQLKKFGGNVTWQDLGCETKLPYICEKIRNRSFSTGAYVAMIIGGLILFSIIIGVFHAAYEKHKRTAVKDIIKAAYQEDISMRERSRQMTFRDMANSFMSHSKAD